VVTGGGEGNPGVGKKRRRRGRGRVESTPTVRSERATSPLRTDGRQRPALRLAAAFYIHPLYMLVSKILSSVLNSFVRIHYLYHHLSTLSRPTYYFI
jgi:hypothetical protein